MRTSILSVVISCLFLFPAVGSAQSPPAPPAGATAPLRVFLDCPTYRCDPDFFRAELPFADFVRSPEDADVQVLVTTVTTGGGGGEYTITVLGRGRFVGRADTLTTYTQADATGDELRKALVQRLGLALARYVALSPSADRFKLTYNAPDSEHAAVTQGVRDPWNYWAFRVRFNTFLNGEKSYHSSNLNANLGATRTTAALKIEASAYRSKDRSEFQIDDTTTFVNTSESYGASLLVAPSLGPHWGWATYAQASRSTYSNEALELDLRTGLEFDVWPYQEVTRRLLALRALVGVKHFKYDEITLYGQTSETRPSASLEASLDVTQPWGSVGASLEASTYLHDASKHRLQLSGNANVRLVRGLSLSIFGQVASIHDQLFLPAAGATDQEILLRRRQLATNYSYYTSIGLSYRFGSLFNNVVNPRFR